MNFDDVPLPKRVEVLGDNGVFAVGVAAGFKHTLVAGADGAVWGFGFLNETGAWNDPMVKAMREAEGGTWDGDYELFGLSTVSETEQLAHRDCFNFLFPRDRASICMPVRIPVDVRGPVLQQARARFAEHV
jgi:hypothetical protein